MEHRVTAKLLAALKASDLPAEAYVRGLTGETAKKFLRPGLTFYKSPQPIERVLARATLAIHHGGSGMRSEENTSELQSLMRISYAVFRLQKKQKTAVKQASHPTYLRLIPNL